MAQLIDPSKQREYEINNMKNPRLTRDSAASVKLREWLSTGKLTGEEEPKEVWLMDPLFMNHKLANFRTCYNNSRKEKCYPKEDLQKVSFFIMILFINYLTHEMII